MPTTAACLPTFSRALLIFVLLCAAVSPLTASTAAAKTGTDQMHYLPYILSEHSGLGCEVVHQTPVDGAFFLAGEPINVSWTLHNLSDKPWLAEKVVIRNTGGVMGSSSVFDLQYDVSPDGEYVFDVVLEGQSNSGTYSSNWGLYEDTVPLCRFFVQFRVP